MLGDAAHSLDSEDESDSDDPHGVGAAIGWLSARPDPGVNLGSWEGQPRHSAPSRRAADARQQQKQPPMPDQPRLPDSSWSVGELLQFWTERALSGQDHWEPEDSEEHKALDWLGDLPKRPVAAVSGSATSSLPSLAESAGSASAEAQQIPNPLATIRCRAVHLERERQARYR